MGAYQTGTDNISLYLVRNDQTLVKHRVDGVLVTTYKRF